jgi:hypothetical protein
MSRDLTGVWVQEIPPMFGQLPKTDMVECVQKGNQLEGVIKRILPESERFKRWYFSAQVMPGLVLGVVWPKDETKNSNSYGTIQLNQISDSYFEGFFLEFLCDEIDQKPRFTGEHKQWPIKWKISPS